MFLTEPIPVDRFLTGAFAAFLLLFAWQWKRRAHRAVTDREVLIRTAVWGTVVGISFWLMSLLVWMIEPSLLRRGLGREAVDQGLILGAAILLAARSIAWRVGAGRGAIMPPVAMAAAGAMVVAGLQGLGNMMLNLGYEHFEFPLESLFLVFGGLGFAARSDGWRKFWACAWTVYALMGLVSVVMLFTWAKGLTAGGAMSVTYMGRTATDPGIGLGPALFIVVFGASGAWAMMTETTRDWSTRRADGCRCGYDPTGLPSSVCPECGKQLDPRVLPTQA